ncbi:MAG: hypothetical protein D6719_06695 [Candidatus Dadabacteria bacterium]|nr:MAG: hypothetical protein D6719_06695 [Candidatus Dadabacteria bacterium]
MLKLSFLIAALLLSVFCSISVCAESKGFTAEIKKELDTILADEKYQPRRYVKSPWQKFKERLIVQAGELISRIARRLRESIIFSSGSRWLKKLLDPLAHLAGTLLYTLFYFLLILCGLAAFFFLLKYLFGVPPVAQNKQETVSAISEEISDDMLEQAFKHQHWDALLSMLRVRLRRELESVSGMRGSSTDRELNRKLNQLGKSDPLFEKIARAFERVTFANLPLNSEEIKETYLVYSRRDR